MTPEGFAAPPTPDEAARTAARAHQARLTKPAGALGRLEALAVHLAALQGRAQPEAHPAAITVFAADHGIAAAGVSAYPPAVTRQMVANFARGGAAINVLARQTGAFLEVVHLGTRGGPLAMPNVTDASIAEATADLREAAAMTPVQCQAALEAGRAAVRRSAARGARLWIGGEMGIGNTTSAAALACALLGAEPAHLVGRGTGVDDAGLVRKQAAVAAALRFHGGALHDPLEALRRLGGFEIAALVGGYHEAARQRMACLVDGFIATAAALVAVRCCPALRPWLIFSHRSAETGHQALLDALDAEPLLDLDLRLGEGSGAALALLVIQTACTLHREMATFDAAGVDGRS